MYWAPEFSYMIILIPIFCLFVQRDDIFNKVANLSRLDSCSRMFTLIQSEQREYYGMYHRSGFSQTQYVPDHTEIEIIASFGSAFQVHMDESTCDPLVITLCLTMQNIHIYILHILMVSSKV